MICRHMQGTTNGQTSREAGAQSHGSRPTGRRSADRVAEEAELPNGEQPRTGKPVARLGRKVDGPADDDADRVTRDDATEPQVAGLPKGRSLTSFNDDLEGVPHAVCACGSRRARYERGHG